MASKKMENSASKTVASKAASVKKNAEEKKEPKCTVYVEYKDGQIDVSNIIRDVTAAYSAENKTPAETIEIYIKPEDYAAYYVVNKDPQNKKVDLHFSSDNFSSET